MAPIAIRELDDPTGYTPTPSTFEDLVNFNPINRSSKSSVGEKYALHLGISPSDGKAQGDKRSYSWQLSRAEIKTIEHSVRHFQST